MSPDDVLAKLRLLLKPILDRSGRVLFSGSDTLVPGELYVMGINPGGEVNQRNMDETIEASLKPSENWNYFTSYPEKSGGWSPLQQRVRSIFDALAVDPRRTLTTNAVFLRSPQVTDLAGIWDKWWGLCWPAHQLMLHVVRPKLIVCLGNGEEGFNAYEALRTPFSREGNAPYTRHPVWQAIGNPDRASGTLDDVTLDLGCYQRHSCMVLGLRHPSPWNQEYQNNSLSDAMRTTIDVAKARLKQR